MAELSYECPAEYDIIDDLSDEYDKAENSKFTEGVCCVLIKETEYD